MSFQNHIKQVAPRLSQIKSRQPAMLLGNKVIVAGIGGNFIPGNAAASQSGTANIAAGYITISDSVIIVHNVTDGTTSTTDKLYIADTGVEEPDYAADGTPQPVPASTDFYKCAAVNSDSTWSGYKANKLNGIWKLESESTEGLQYIIRPEINGIYTEDASIRVDSLIPETSDIVMYAPLKEDPTVPTGQILSETSPSGSIPQGNGSIKRSKYGTIFDSKRLYMPCLFQGHSADEFTIMFRFCSLTSNQCILYSEASVNDYYGIFIVHNRDTSKRLMFGMRNTSTGNYGTRSDLYISDISNYQWHDLCAVYSANQQSVYIDGQLAGTMNGGPALTQDSNTAFIGDSGRTCAFADFLAFNKALTASQIQNFLTR